MSKNELADTARALLLSRVAAMREADDQLLPEPVAKIVTAKRGDGLTDVSSLPGYEELRLQRSIGEKLGLENPYFRMHDGLAGAHTEIGGRRLLNFSCYDYLGLNGHPDILAAATSALNRYGVSAAGSRHVSGERPVHRSLERALADHYQCEEALVFVSGYATNVGVLGQIAGPKDLILCDAAMHNSAVLGSVLSGAARRNFAHNDLDDLERVLASSREQYQRLIIVVEGVYSMDGDYPDLPRLIEIKNRYRGWLMVDEAHALGVLGGRGFGVAEHFKADPRDVDIWMGTLSKTLAGCGGYIAGSGELVDYLRLTVGSFVYSVGMPPVIAAAAETALHLLHREPERVARLQANAALFLRHAKSKALDTGLAAGTAVVPVIVGDSIGAVMLSQTLFERGINVQPVLYPAVPMKQSRLRFFLTAMHTEDEIRHAIDIVTEEMARLPTRLEALTASHHQGG